MSFLDNLSEEQRQHLLSHGIKTEDMFRRMRQYQKEDGHSCRICDEIEWGLDDVALAESDIPEFRKRLEEYDERN